MRAGLTEFAPRVSPLLETLPSTAPLRPGTVLETATENVLAAALFVAKTNGATTIR